VTGSRLDDSPWGSGLDLSQSRDITISNNEAGRNALHGIRATESQNVRVRGNLVEGNDGAGIRFDALMDGCRDIEVRDNLARNNGSFGIEIGGGAGGAVRNNTVSDNGQSGQIKVTSSVRITR
jgi:parallel beta-helix repeat protein